MARVWWRAGLYLSLACLGNLGFSKFTVAQTTEQAAPFKVLVDALAKKGDAASLDVTNLTALIDGKPAQVLSARPANDDKLLFAVLVDISSSGRGQQKAVKDAVAKLFQALTHENSLGYLVFFNTQTYPTKRPILASEAQSLLDQTTFGGGTSLYDSVTQVASDILSREANKDTPRRVIIILSDGDDNYSNMPFDAMQKIVQRQGISIFMLTQNEAAPSKAKYVVEELARNTGGRVITREPMPDGVPELLAAIHGQVELTIAAPQTPTGGLHSLSVRTSEKGVTITAPAQIIIP